MTWLSSYLYHEGNPDQVLRETVSPFVRNVLKQKQAEHVFFIRYGDKKGPHIRLRFQGNSDILEANVKPQLQQTFPNIRFVRYVPELKRYGGKTGVAIAEKLFEASSLAVLEYLKSQPEATYTQKLGFALQLNLSMIQALGMERPEAHAFFAHIAGNDTADYAKSFEKTAATIVPALQKLWSKLNDTVEITPEWFATWFQAVKKISDELQQAYKENELTNIDPHKNHAPYPLWYLYESYVHMNNNRLGIDNSDEQYIAYILQQALA